MILDIPTPRWAVPLLKPARNKGAYGGRGSGKSHFFAEYIVENHAANPQDSTVCVREVQKSLDQSVKRLIEQKIEKLNVGYYFDVQDAKIKSHGGDGLIIFQGMQNHTAESIKSLERYNRAWVEEAQTLSQYSLDLLRPTIRTPGSEILYSWNPRYKTDAVDKFLRKNPPTDSVVVNVNWKDNPWFPDVLRKDLEDDFRNDPDKAEHIWNGAYGFGEGSILSKWMYRADREGRINETVEFDPEGAPVEISSDIGFRDTSCWWFWQPKVGGFSLFDYDGDHGLEAQEWCERLSMRLAAQKIKKEKLGKIWLPHDARAKTFQSKHSAVEQFIKYFGADKVSIVPQSNKSDRINAARKVMDRCEFRRDRCEGGIDGLTAWEFEFNEETNAFSREPVHNWASHPGDAFSYGCQIMSERVIKENKIEPIRGLTVGNVYGITVDELWTSVEPEKRKRI